MNPAKRAIRSILRCGLQMARGMTPDKAEEFETPRRILLLNAAHLGDIVISTGMIPVLKSAFPDVKIGFAVGSWSANILNGHPDMTWVHKVDHWRANRSNSNMAGKFAQSWRTHRQVLSELRAIKYDWAICLHPFHPDLLPLAWRAGIPVRAAFSSAPCSPLATCSIPYTGYDRFITQGACQAELLRALGIEERHLRRRKSSLPPSNEAALEEIRALFSGVRSGLPKYCVIHMGAGATAKELSVEFWREMTESLSRRGIVVFTGAGEREARNVSRVMEGFKNCVNACSKLSWPGFVAVLRHATEVYSVDTGAAHAAAAVGVPVQVVSTGIGGPSIWRPEGPAVTVWTNYVPCSPCFRRNGCSEMTCLKGIVSADLLRDADMRRAEKVVSNDSAWSAADFDRSNVQ